MALVERRCRVSEGDAGRADLAVRRLTGKSRAEVRGLFDHACVAINGAPCGEAGRELAPGDAVVVRFDPHTRYHAKRPEREDPAFRVVFEDEHLIVVDKAARVLTVPAERSKSQTLVDAVSRRLSRRGKAVRAMVVHRLDRGVSGLLVMAKTSVVAGRLQSELRSRHMEREYVAVVAGTLSPAEGTFDSFLKTSESLDRYSSEDDDGAQRAVTHYRVERTTRGATVVRVRLDTGRRHQIRVHFAEAGHPVLGDRRYRRDLSWHDGWIPGRLALHAATLSFRHPATGTVLRFESPPPREFERFLTPRVTGRRSPDGPRSGDNAPPRSGRTGRPRRRR